MDSTRRPPVLGSTVSLAVRNLAFTIVVPGLGGIWAPWQIATRDRHGAAVLAWQAMSVIAAGTVLYAICLWTFASTGRGTPGLWDSPSRMVAAGPYRWVRNPIYLSALVIVGGQAWLFGSLPVLEYASAMALFFHLFVIGYEEPALRRRFGDDYVRYRCAVPRWIPRRPHGG